MNFQTTRTGTNIIKQFSARGNAQVLVGQEKPPTNQNDLEVSQAWNNSILHFYRNCNSENMYKVQQLQGAKNLNIKIDKRDGDNYSI